MFVICLSFYTIQNNLTMELLSRYFVVLLGTEQDDATSEGRDMEKVLK